MACKILTAKQQMQAALDDVLRLRSRAFTSQTLLAASALFDRPFTIILEICFDEAAARQHLLGQTSDDENSDADTVCENSLGEVV